jgi:hypothetical protein
MCLVVCVCFRQLLYYSTKLENVKHFFGFF